MSNKTSKRILAVTLALLAASQLAGCGGGDDNDSPGTTNPPGSSGDPSGGGTGGGGTGGGGTGGGDTGGGGTGGGGDTGGGGTGGDGGGGGTPGPLTSGTFVDAPVAGLSYTTSSNQTGVTDADGRYNYRVGDTVTFSLGNLVLGTVPAQGVVTPMTVATALVANTSNNAETVAVNLLMLLQSLDDNNNPEDGITLLPNVVEEVAASSIDLTASDAAFDSALTTFVSNVSTASGHALTAVDRQDATDHFIGQAPTALAGVYIRANANFEPITQKIVTLSMFRSGRYLLGGQYDLAECERGDSSGTPDNELVFSDARGNGVESGTYDWNPLTGAFEIVNVTVETDGFCGFNEPIVDATNDTTELEITTQGLVFRDADGNVTERFVRLESSGSSVAGTWVQPTGLMKGQPLVFSLFPSAESANSGRYLIVDATLPTPEDTSPGIEEGCYTIDANTNNVTVELNSSVCPNAIDTNDTAGMSHSSGAQLLVDENGRLVVIEGPDVTGFARLPIEQLTHAKLAGAWAIESDPSVELGEQEYMALLTVFEDGRFLFGTQENNAECIAGDYVGDLTQEQNGNGLEYGMLTLAGGLVAALPTRDTNGECGLYDQGRNGTQRYFVVPNAARDALVLWPNDDEDPAGVVLKRVPSTANDIHGAWLWREEGGAADEFAVVAYLPGGSMFEVSLFPGFEGLLRESFSMNGDVMTSYAAGYEYCVDTEENSACDGPAEPIVEQYVVEGDVIIDDDMEGAIITRIPGAE